MKILVFDAHSYDRDALNAANSGRHDLHFTDISLKEQTVSMAEGFLGVCCFVNDQLSAAVLQRLAAMGIRFVGLRCTGFNNVDLAAAQRHGVIVTRVTTYSPHAVAEHALALLQTLNRHTHRAYNRTREFNFRLAGLMGRDLHGMTVGVVGTGRIGAAFASIMHGCGCVLLGHDVMQNPACKQLDMNYVALPELLKNSDVVSLHLPLTPDTHHMINAASLALMKPDAFLINTSRGGLLDTAALINTLKSGRLAGVGLDVYEEEGGIFFRDLSNDVMADEVLARLMTFANVLITGHQGFFTREAMNTIASTTLQNFDEMYAGLAKANTLT